MELKEIILKGLSFLKEEYRILLEYKYFKIIPNIENFDNKSRNYFRKQVRAIDKFHEALIELGYDEKWFFDNYLKIAFINGLYQKTLKEEGKKHVE